MLAAASQDRRRKRATAGGRRTTTGEGTSDGIAAEARDLVRQAAGNVTGKTVAAQVRQAARHLGYGADDWRVREAWYGRAEAWSAAAVDDLRRRFATWQERAETGACAAGPSTLAQRVTAVRRLLAELDRQVAGLEAEITRSTQGETRPHGGSTADV